MSKLCHVMWLLLCVAVSIKALADDAAVQTPETEPTSAPATSRESVQTPGYFSLPLGDETIAATFLEETLGKNHGNVLILPERSGEIDSVDIVHTLRTQLPTSGWSTMTIALDYPAETGVFLATENSAAAEDKKDDNAAESAQPTTSDVAPADAAESTSTEAENTEPQSIVSNAARLAGAIEYLQARNPGQIVVIALGDSANLATSALGNLATQYGIIVINATAPVLTIPQGVPVLDIAPSRDDVLLQAAIKRRAAIQREQSQATYSQRVVHGADRLFSGFDATLFSVIRAWLNKQFVRGEQP